MDSLESDRKTATEWFHVMSYFVLFCLFSFRGRGLFWLGADESQLVLFTLISAGDSLMFNAASASLLLGWTDMGC